MNEYKNSERVVRVRMKIYSNKERVDKDKNWESVKSERENIVRR